MLRLLCAIMLFVVAAGAVSAAEIWNETSGDLSDDRLNPDAFLLTPGSNNLIGTVIGGSTADLDYVALTVPANHLMTQIVLELYESTDSRAFIGVQQGGTFTEPPAGTDVSQLLGWSHIGPGGAQQGTDILDDIGLGGGAIGFTPPLAAGQYSFWIQQTGSALTSYNFNFVVEEVPEPSTLLLGGIGAAAVAGLAIRRRRRQSPSPATA